MKWPFQIERTTLDQRNLLDLLDRIGYQQADVPGLDLVFCSKTLEACVTAGEVWEEAKRIRDLISEVTEIDPEFTLGPVIDLSSGEPKRHHFLEVKSGIIVTTGVDAILTVSPPDNLSAEQLIEYNRRRTEQEYKAKLEVHAFEAGTSDLVACAAKVQQATQAKSGTAR